MWEITFYTSDSDRAPVRDFMEKKLNDDQRTKLRERLKLLRVHGPQMAEEYPKALKRLTGKDLRDLYEIRIANDQLRVFLFFHEKTAVLAHAVTKAGKGKKTIRTQYATALTRRNNWLQRRSDA
jgi:hypothetical protein